MNELLYYQDQYQKEAEAKIVQVEGNKVLLDKTIFIPESNTELGDLGEINGVAISGSVKDENGNIWHIITEISKLKEGENVRLVLDWANRLFAMRIHSALHLFAGPFENMGKRPVAGAAKGNEIYLVFKEEIGDDLVEKSLMQANSDVERGLEIKSYWDENRAGFRWTQVGEYPAIPDGGLHVKNTKEIGKINFVGKKLESGKEKIIISIS